MDLPRSLAPWGSYLGLFPRDLALSLGPVLQRLSFAVGPLRVRRHQGEGEVDGYDGITRHGSYERLLASEWLLAEELPEEFLRRAAGSEHLFLRVARPVPSGSRTSVAVFDAGPGQLGSPRIAQLAAMIVLARRAESAGVRFSWGVLQDPEAPLFQEVNETNLLRLLQARTPHEATDAQIAAWNARLHGWKELDDFWIVGPPRLSGVPSTRGASLLQVWDVLDPDARRVAVRVRRGTPTGFHTPSEISLELPDNTVCARLLRDPFSVGAPAPHRLEPRLAPASDLLFAASPSKLFARAAGGGVAGYPVPNSPRAEAGAPRLYDPWPGRTADAVGFAGKQIVLAACQADGSIALHYAHKRGEGSPGGVYAPGPSAAIGDEPFRPGEPEAPLLPFVRTGGHSYLLDAAGTLFRLSDPPGRSFARVASRVSAIAAVAAHLVLVEAASPAGPARLAILTGMGTGMGTAGTGGTEPAAAPALATAHPLPDAADGAPAFFGFGGRVAHPEHGLVAVGNRDGSWSVLSLRGHLLLSPFAGTRVMGVAADPQRHEPGLVIVEEDGRTLALAGLSWTRRLPPASAEIRHAAASSTAPYVAWTTIHGEVVVYSLAHDAVLFRRVPEGEAES
jgi:hypothetical protein